MGSQYLLPFHPDQKWDGESDSNNAISLPPDSEAIVAAESNGRDSEMLFVSDSGFSASCLFGLEEEDSEKTQREKAVNFGAQNRTGLGPRTDGPGESEGPVTWASGQLETFRVFSF